MLTADQFIEIALSGDDLDAAEIYARGDVYPEAVFARVGGRWIVL